MRFALACLSAADAFGVRDGRFQDGVHIGLRWRADRHPAHPLEPDVVAHLQAENEPVEGERILVVDGDEAL
jgi:hypothetical protein